MPNPDTTRDEERFHTFLDRITDGFIVLDRNFRYVYVNKQIGALLQRDPQHLIGKSIWEEFPELVDSYTFRSFQTAMKEQRFISNVDYYAPLHLWQENYIYPSPEGLSILVRDISERKKMEKELADWQRQHQFDVMIAALEAGEKERTHIGRELHDNVNQMLVATNLLLNLMRDDYVGDARLLRCIANLEGAIIENRKLSHELITPELQEAGLVEQLQNLLHNTLVITKNITVSIDSGGFREERLSQPQKLTVYRIVQEQCTNILKHAEATAVALTLATSRDAFEMTIADNGKGAEKKAGSDGVGLKNMQGRVTPFDGEVAVRSTLGGGFVVSVHFPLPVPAPHG